MPDDPATISRPIFPMHQWFAENPVPHSREPKYRVHYDPHVATTFNTVITREMLQLVREQLTNVRLRHEPFRIILHPQQAVGWTGTNVRYTADT